MTGTRTPGGTVPPNLGPNQALDGTGLDPFLIAAEYATVIGDTSGSYRIDYLGPWLWKDGELVVTPHFCFWRSGQFELLDPPAPVLKMLKGWESRAHSVHVPVDRLKEWAGAPFHLKCCCRFCGDRYRHVTSPMPGRIGDALVDRRFVALALELDDDDTRRIRIIKTMRDDGDAIRIDSNRSWAGIMGLRLRSGDERVPRFELW